MPTVWMGRLLRAGRVAAQPAGSARHARAVHIPGYVCTRDELDSRIRSAVSSALGQLVPAGPSVSRSRMLHGDYQSGVALAAARAAKRPPPDVARLVAAHLDGSGIVEDISVTGELLNASAVYMLVVTGGILFRTGLYQFQVRTENVSYAGPI